MIVPGGGLAAHEAAGGHTIARHIGYTESQLASRLAAEPILSSSSSFTDIATAELTIADAINANTSALASWLSSRGKRYTIGYTASSPVGISLSRGASSAVTASGVKVVLVREASLSLGYYILTAYPTP